KCIFCRKGLKTHCPERLVLGIFKKNGAFAEFVTLPVENLHVLPDSVSDEEGVFVEPLAAAFQITEQVHIRPASKVCVMGEGKLGNLVAQVLGNTGCDLTVIGKYHKKLELLRQKGIKTALSSTEDQERIFDVVVDCTGSSKGIQTALKAVRPGGTLIQKTTVGGKSEIELNELVIHEITVQGSRCGPFGPAIRALSERLVDVKCMISDVFKLSDGVRAFRRATESGVMKVLLQP
ncbi:MAG: zinc-binding dehydrogenase, partial [Nitrospinota bacterium]